METIKEKSSLSIRTIVNVMVPGLRNSLKYFVKKDGKIFLEAANPAYEPFELIFEY